MRASARWTVLLGIGGACAGPEAPVGSSDFPVQFTVSNNLLAPVSIAIDGVAQITLRGGSSTGLTVSSRSQWLTWISAKPMDSEGRPIPDDISEVRVAVHGINRELEITNIINDQTYITARIYNLATEPASIGVFDGSSVSCAAQLPASDGRTAGFTMIGYYKLLAATEVRAYRDAASCTGPYSAWSAADIRNFTAKSGVLTLVLEAGP